MPSIHGFALESGHVVSETQKEVGAKLPLQGTICKETKTNVEGKYLITDVDPGRYYIYASFESDSLWVEWLIPLEIKAGEEKSVDLDNDNAARIRDE